MTLIDQTKFDKALDIDLSEAAQQDIERGINMRHEAKQLTDKAAKIIAEADSILMPALILANLKSVLLPQIGQAVYTEGRKNSPTCSMEDFIKQLAKRGVSADTIAAAKKAATKPPKKAHGDPGITFNPWESYQAKLNKGRK